MGRSARRALAGSRAARVAAWALLVLLAAPARGGEADVVDVAVQCEESLCVFAVTVRHADAGWEHYADRWEVRTPEGELLGARTLAHPHVGEQPFTRRLPGVRIPPGVARVVVRAHDSVHGFGGAEREVTLPLQTPERPEEGTAPES